MCYMDLSHTCYKDLIGYEVNGYLKNDYDANPFINAYPSHMNIVFVFLACRYISLFKRGLCAHKIYLSNRRILCCHTTREKKSI
jgi:hypothetical protein